MNKYMFINKKITVIYILFLLIDEIMTVLISFFLQYVIDIVNNPNRYKLKKVLVYALVFLVFYMIFDYTSRIIRIVYFKKTFTYIKADMIKGMLSWSIEKFNKKAVATYISNFNNELPKIEEQYFNSIFDCIGAGTAFLVSIIAMYLYEPLIALIVILLSLCSFIIPFIFSKKLAFSEKEFMNKLENFTGYIKDFLTGFEIIKIFQIEKNIINNFEKINTNVENYKFKHKKIMAQADTSSNVMSIFIQILIFIISGFWVLQGKITIGIIVAITQLSGNITSSILRIIENVNEIQSVSEIAKDIIYNTNRDNETKYTKTKYTKINGNINVKNLTFSYNQKIIIDDISVEFEYGKKYAIVGRSGSGKSTFMKLLLHYYDNYRGSIMLGQDDYKNLSLDQLYQNISVIHQNVFMFDDTLRNNITLYNNYDDNKIKEYLKKVGLVYLIDRMEEKVGDGGIQLSGGERQRISIIRALLSSTNILCMDEGTSNLDEKRATEIENILLSMKDITEIIITHKMNKQQLEKYNKIYVIKDGKIIEQGNFKELFNMKQEFYSLYTINN